MLSAAAYAGMFVFGIVMALLGAILPALATRLSFDAASIGALFVYMNFAMLGCSAVVGTAMDRYGMKLPLVGGPILVALAIGLIPRAGRFEDLIPAVLLLGLGGGALNAATNTLVADLHEDEKSKGAALNLLGVFFGFGALFLPFVIGGLIETFGINALLFATMTLCLGAGLLPAALRFPAPKQRHAMPWREMPRFLKSPLVLTLGVLLFFQSGVEFTLGGFIGTYLTSGLSAGVAQASWILAGYWAALMLARIVLSRLLLRAEPHDVVLISAAAACAGSAEIAFAGGITGAAISIVLVGFAMAGIYPTVLGVAGSQFREHSGTVFGILFTMALTGGMIIPWTAGRAAGAVGLHAVFYVVAGAFACVVALNAVVSRLARRTAPDARGARAC